MKTKRKGSRRLSERGMQPTRIKHTKRTVELGFGAGITASNTEHWAQDSPLEQVSKAFRGPGVMTIYNSIGFFSRAKRARCMGRPI
jgi:hypothetical protein